MKATEDYHKMQACEYYQHNECDCLTECSFETKPALLTPSLPSEKEDDLITELDDIVGGTYFNVRIYPETVVVIEKRGSNNSIVKEFNLTHRTNE